MRASNRIQGVKFNYALSLSPHSKSDDLFFHQQLTRPRTLTLQEDPERIACWRLWDGGCAHAAWSDEGLRRLEAARQYSVPSAACRLACSEPVEGDRIAWTNAAGRRTGEVLTIEAVVATRTETANGHEIALRTIRAFGPGAPEPTARSTAPQGRSPRAAASAPSGPTRPRRGAALRTGAAGDRPPEFGSAGIDQPVEFGLPVEPRIDGIAKYLPALLQTQIGHALLLDLGRAAGARVPRGAAPYRAAGPARSPGARCSARDPSPPPLSVRECAPIRSPSPSPRAGCGAPPAGGS